VGLEQETSSAHQPQGRPESAVPELYALQEALLEWQVEEDQCQTQLEPVCKVLPLARNPQVSLEVALPCQASLGWPVEPRHQIQRALACKVLQCHEARNLLVWLAVQRRHRLLVLAWRGLCCRVAQNFLVQVCKELSFHEDRSLLALQVVPHRSPQVQVCKEPRCRVGQSHLAWQAGPLRNATLLALLAGARCHPSQALE